MWVVLDKCVRTGMSSATLLFCSSWLRSNSGNPLPAKFTLQVRRKSMPLSEENDSERSLQVVHVNDFWDWTSTLYKIIVNVYRNSKCDKRIPLLLQHVVSSENSLLIANEGMCGKVVWGKGDWNIFELWNLLLWQQERMYVWSWNSACW